jgi:hypothetical protein
MRNQVVDLISKHFGRLTVISFAETYQGDARWLCRCDCGNECIVFAHNLKSGSTKSCGCLMVERVRKANTKHGDWTTPEWKAWSSARERCNNPKNKDWKNYGGRGITMNIDYADFLADVGRRPSPKHLLDRINNEKNYERGNLKWSTPKESSNNRRPMSINRLGQSIIR